MSRREGRRQQRRWRRGSGRGWAVRCADRKISLLGQRFNWGGGLRVCCNIHCKCSVYWQHTRTPPPLRNSIRVHFGVGSDQWCEVPAQRAEQVGSTRRGQTVRARVEMVREVKTNAGERGARRRRAVNGIRNQAAGA